MIVSIAVIISVAANNNLYKPAIQFDREAILYNLPI